MPARLLRVLSKDAPNGDAASILDIADPEMRPALLACFERAFHRAAEDILETDPNDVPTMKAHALYAQLMALSLQLATEAFGGPVAIYVETPAAAD